LKRWTRAQTALLGTATDREVARILGMNKPAVTRKREQLGVPPFVARWSTAEKALLGADTDAAIAKLLGRSQSAVETKRRQLRIPEYR